MNQREAKRKARLYIASLISNQANDESIAGFLRVPFWVGEEMHPDVYMVSEAVSKFTQDLRRTNT